jgi:outer membrane protein OmpA-like peptidoglycan-associated protein
MTSREGLLILVLGASAVPQAPQSAAPKIPLREGLTIVGAYRNDKGDYENIRRVTRADTTSITVELSTDQPPENMQNNPIAELLGGNCREHGAQPDPKKRWIAARKVLREDIEKAHAYRQEFIGCTDKEDFHPGSTALGFSANVLRELKAKGQTKLDVSLTGNPAAAFNNMIGQLLGGSSKELEQAAMTSGVLTRVEPMNVPFKVIANDEPTELPAIHARWRAPDHLLEYWILDDDANPLVLRATKPGGSFQLQVIKLAFPVAVTASPAATTAADKMERELAKQGRTVVYGIYFDFASDRIKAESQPVLADIAKVLQQNPSWSLGVEGHTDNIGGDPYNLDLARRRAAAVKQALVTQYKVDAKRLDTSGYGASRPKDTNTTLEGRARNRRVELTRNSIG